METTNDIGVTALQLRESFGLSKGYASDLVNRKRSPSLALAVQIEREFGVPVATWIVATAHARSDAA